MTLIVDNIKYIIGIYIFSRNGDLYCVIIIFYVFLNYKKSFRGYSVYMSFNFD